MGTFSLIPSYTQSVTGSWLTNVGGVILNPATSDSIIAAINVCDAVINYANPNFPVSNQTVGLSIRPGASFILDSITTDRLLTPMGFLITDYTMQYTKWFASISPYDITLKQGPEGFEYSFSPVISTLAGGLTSCGNAAGQRTRTLTALSTLNNYSVLYDPFGFSIASYGSSSLGPNFLGLTGNYIQWSNSLTKSPTTGGPGTKITISDGNNKLLQITELQIQWQQRELVNDVERITLSDAVVVPSNYIVSQTASQFIFYIPSNLRIPWNRKLIIMGKGNGVEFSGTIPLAILNVVLTNGSGIYNLTPDKRNDTYYDRSVSPVSTVALKIPDPFLKTGFFNV